MEIEQSSASAPAAPEVLYSCEIQVDFPTDLQAQQALEILQVDSEPTDRVSKSFRLESRSGNPTSMIVHIESNELKMLRVAVSSFYDYLTLTIKTMQEFDATMESHSDPYE